jgi:6-phosphogluconolactonase (cycloisomerase 2 family)
VSLSHDGSKVGFAVYLSGVSGVLPLAEATPLCFNHPDEGVGPNAKRQKKAYAHCAVFNPPARVYRSPISEPTVFSLLTPPR